MKAFAILFFAVVVSAEIDWSNVKPITEIEGFWDGRDPELVKAFSLTKFNRRIVNGEIAAPHQFPYQVRGFTQKFVRKFIFLLDLQVALLTTFGTAGTGLCGGSVISATAILTAAHCSDDRVTSFQIIFGAVNRRNQEANQQRRTVPPSGWTQHPDYIRLTLHNDVAVIRFTSEPLTLNLYVQTIALAQNNDDLFVDEIAHVSGFGRYSDDSSATSDVVRFTIKTVITNLSCRIRFPINVISTTICAVGTEEYNNAICNGDSGGPLAARYNGISLQIGIVSFLSPLGCERSVPDGYARVTSFYSWIREVAQM